MQANQKLKQSKPRSTSQGESSAKRALVLQTAFLGDVALSIPLLKRLKGLEFEVTYICREGLGSFLESTGLVCKALEVRKGESRSYSQVLHKLGTFDLALSVHESIRSSLLFQKIRAQRKVAFRTWANRILGFETVHRDLRLPDPLRQLQVLTGIDPETQDLIQKSIQVDWTSTSLDAKAHEILKGASMKLPGLQRSPEKRVILAPGSRWLTKRWTLEGYLAVAKDALQKGYEVCCVGSPDERDICEELHRQEVRIENLAGQTNLNQLLEVLQRADFLVCNDSGVMHLGSIVGLPTVSVFGPTVLSQGYRPWNSKAQVVERQGLSCRPCGKHGHMECPIGTHECMKSLSPTAVLDAISRLSLDR